MKDLPWEIEIKYGNLVKKQIINNNTNNITFAWTCLVELIN